MVPLLSFPSICLLPALVVVIRFSFRLPIADAHGLLMYPNQRGTLNPRAPFIFNPVYSADRSPIDYFAHFPAGPKGLNPGTGHRYQIRHVGPHGWTPYNPFDPSFRFRAGICGDAILGRAHRKGGRFYDGGRISATFEQGGVLDAVIGIVAHHNGFIQLYVCDVSKCHNGEISHGCFVSGHCVQLKRAKEENDRCEGGFSKKCAPTDPTHPGRWYLPCKANGTSRRSSNKNGVNYVTFGPGTIRYRLPPDLTCEHCVLQWHWTSANNCNPPGVIDFFEGPHGPKNWMNCVGQAGAKGGYTKVQAQCGGRSRVPEEYYQCSDIRIMPKMRSETNTTENNKTEVQSNATTLSPSPSRLPPVPPPSPSTSEPPVPSLLPSGSTSAVPSSSQHLPDPESLPTVSISPGPSSKKNTTENNKAEVQSNATTLSPSPSRLPPVPPPSPSTSEPPVPSLLPSGSTSAVPSSSQHLPDPESLPTVSISPGISLPSSQPYPEYVPHSRGHYTGVIKDIILVRNGLRVQTLLRDPFVRYERTATYTIEAYLHTNVTQSQRIAIIEFLVFDRSMGKFVVEQRQQTHDVQNQSKIGVYMFGTSSPTANKSSAGGFPYGWKNIPMERLLYVRVSVFDVNDMRMDTRGTYCQFTFM